MFNMVHTPPPQKKKWFMWAPQNGSCGAPEMVHVGPELDIMVYAGPPEMVHMGANRFLLSPIDGS